MTHTVIGLFDNKNEARQAMEELVAQGFIREHIDVSDRRFDDSSATTGTTDTTTASGTGVGDSISNFFSSLFGDDQTTAQTYTNAAYDADAILTVQVDSQERAAAAAEILDRHGAIDVDSRASQYNQQNFSQTSGTTTQNTGTMQNTATTTEGEMAIPVIEEELQVGKREVERGGARIRSRVIERPVEETLRLREEHIVVNRQPVNRAVTDADLQNFQEGDIELTERSEEAVVSKQSRVVEEVSVGKEVSEREETIRDTVRRTDVEVEETGGNVTTSSTTDTDDNVSTRRATS